MSVDTNLLCTVLVSVATKYCVSVCLWILCTVFVYMSVDTMCHVYACKYNSGLLTDQHNDPHGVVDKEEGAETDHGPTHGLVVASRLQTHHLLQSCIQSVMVDKHTTFYSPAHKRSWSIIV